MRKTLMIYISGCLLCFGLVFFSFGEQPVESSVSGRVLGAYEISDFELIRSDLSLSDVLVRAAMPADEMPASEEAAGPAIPKKAADRPGFSLDANSAIAVDFDSNEVLFEQNADAPVPIASISKLMTALVFLDLDPDWNDKYQIKPADYAGGGYQHVVVGDTLDLRSLFSLSLVASANTATQALAGAVGKTSEEFVALMNEKAAEMKLEQTSFRDPVGLSRYNISTAREVAKIVKAAMVRPEIRDVLALDKYECLTAAGTRRIGRSTNKLLSRDLPEGLAMQGGKTGYTQLAGNCFAGNFIINREHGIITVILGANTENERFSESLAMAGWIKNSYVWQ